MNARCYGREISDVLSWAQIITSEHLTENSEQLTVNNERIKDNNEQYRNKTYFFNIVSFRSLYKR